MLPGRLWRTTGRRDGETLWSCIVSFSLVLQWTCGGGQVRYGHRNPENLSSQVPSLQWTDSEDGKEVNKITGWAQGSMRACGSAQKLSSATDKTTCKT